MVQIFIVVENNLVIMDCYERDRNNAYFRLVVDKNTLKIIEKPEECNINVSISYSRICSLIKSGKPLPKETCAAWG